MLANHAQQQVIDTVDGPVIVIACPGAGKTTTLIHRIRHMVESGVPENQILMVTFTKAAADHMRKKYESEYGPAGDILFYTIHSLCFRILKAQQILNREDIITEEELHALIYGRIRNWHKIPDAWDMAKNVIAEISRVKNGRLDPNSHEPASCQKKIFQDLWEYYETYRKKEHKFDFDDILILTEELLRENAALRKAYQDRFRYLQCDEYQDTNRIQKEILYLLTGENRNFCVVGDDDQSIYGFRGAKPQVMFDFKKDFPDCSMIPMHTNYRSGQQIIAVSDMLIKDSARRFEKEFLSFRGEQGFEGDVQMMRSNSRDEEVRDVIRQIKKLHEEGTEYRDMAILYRTNRLAELPLDALAGEQIPFISQETLRSVYSGWVFRTLCAYVSLAMGKWKQEWMDTVITTPNKYLKKAAFDQCPYNETEMLNRLSYMTESWQYRNAERNIETIMSAFSPGRITEQTSPARIMQAFRRIGIEKAITDRAEAMHEDAQEALLVLERMDLDAARCETWLEWTQLAKNDIARIKALNEQRNNANGVTACTMHMAKGREWKAVFVIDINEKIMPHRNAEDIEEERRLLYVAMTRAEDKLFLYSSGLESRFLSTLKARQRKEKAKQYQGSKPDPGTLLMHGKFGMGILDSYSDNDILVVDFAGEKKKFRFPEAFLDKHLVMI